MSAAAEEKKLVTVAEYLAMDRASAEKHEFFRGEVFAMSGASYEHNKLVSPEGEVAEFKLCRSDGWPLEPGECLVLGERLQRWLDSGPTLEFAGARFDLPKGARGRDDKEARLALEDLARFFLLASRHDGAVAR